MEMDMLKNMLSAKLEIETKCCRRTAEVEIFTPKFGVREES